MTKKTEKKTTTTKKVPVEKKVSEKSEKKILFEAVQEHSEKNYIIVGALTKAGLIGQYLHEESVYGVEDIEPTITEDELNKIIKDFIGA